MSAEYVALLRPHVGETVEEPLQYRKALDLIRHLAVSDRLTANEIVSEIRGVFAALARIQEDLDSAEDGYGTPLA